MKKLLIIFFLLCSIAYADAPTRQVVYVSATTIRDEDVTANEDKIFGYLQKGVDVIATGGLNAITEIHSALRSGDDQTLVTGTKGATNTYGKWNADGDLVTGGLTPFLSGVTSDPCATYGARTIFYNNTGDYPCYCNSSKVDLKLSDDSACF